MAKTEHARQPIYGDKYFFKLKFLTRELQNYVLLLKDTVSYSPWFENLVLRSLIEADDRRMGLIKLGISKNHDEYDPFNFILMVKFKAMYKVKITPETTEVVSPDHQDTATKLLMFPTGVPGTLTGQWALLDSLATEANKRK